jgi:hypothetical protein
MKGDLLLRRGFLWEPGAFLLLGAMAQAADPGVEAFGQVEWRAVFQGVEHASVVLKEPRPMRAQVLRVRLETPGLSMVATPDNGEAPGETTGQRTTSFLKAQACQAAINAAPFDLVSSLEGKPLDISGLQVSGGKEVSPDNGYPALLFLKDGRARIQRQPFPGPDILEAVSGFQIVLWQGKTVATDVKLHPRTGAGVSADGRTLWLLVVDGRQAGTSEGCTTLEMAAWLKVMGADSGINLDGGGTTTMVVAGKDGKPVLLNRPVHAGIPGMERPSGSHLGVRARALPTPESAR